ncbi:MAG: PEP-CTERM sorting domain-containing protein [Planctomycetota bacterium]|nr:PEP-CTERM sorting domain-containing protein [Planctomycetota bacterium]
MITLPEPSAIIIVFTGTFSLVGYGWRRKKELAA